MLDQITPIILTYNEAPNIGRTLTGLRWARDIVVVDSVSADATVEIAERFSQVRVFERPFDCHQNQWNFVLRETRISSEWVLALDADYVVTPELAEEIKALRPSERVAGYEARFVYCVSGKPLRGSAYPPVTVLYRREKAIYRQDGHTQRVAVDGEIGQLKSPILHDDRKSLGHWLRSQDRYMRQERVKLQGAWSTEQGAGRRVAPLGIEGQKPEVNDQRSEVSVRLSLADRLRKTRFLFPFVIFFYCLFVKGGIRDGWAGVYYAFQRMLAETLLALYLIEDKLRAEVSGQISEVSEQQGAGGMELGAGLGLENRDQRSDVREDFVRHEA